MTGRYRAGYRFFDAGFVLETDSPAFWTRFDGAYRRLQVAEQAGAPLYQVLLNGQPTAILDGRTTRSSDAGALAQWAFNAILNAATARVRSHLLFHAAALSTPAGGGLIVAGGSGLGKTTLTRALMERGFGFLSDDVAAVGRADGRLCPFPRSLGLRFPGGRPGEKRQVHVAEIALACPVRYLFVLADPAAKAVDQDSFTSDLCDKPFSQLLPGQANDRSWYLVLDHAGEALIADLQAVPGVREAWLVREGPYPALQIDLAARSLPAAEPEIETICQQHGSLLFEMVQGRKARPDFEQPPVLALLSTTEGARGLLRHFKGGPRSDLLRIEFQGSAARLYLSLVSLAAGVASHRLEVGRLDSMVELIMRTVTPDEPPEG